jgi:putative ubiquitin-RnfH superfamily antitoxin RatB of RatAB toxin-antitoxin module
LRDRDRVEIYRALIADPKEARRRRAQAAKSVKKSGPGA